MQSLRAFVPLRANAPRLAHSFSSAPGGDVPGDGNSKGKDTMWVNLNDPSIDTGDFFKYQTGRWLENDIEEREKRTTKFSLPGLLDILKQKVDYLQKTPAQSELAISTIEPFYEGKHNKIFKVTLKDMRVYALRIPYAIGHAEYREKRLLSEVATMDFLQKKQEVRLPTPVAWGGTTSNELESQYILMDYVAGEKLMKYWKPWSDDVQEKSAVIKPAADFVSQIVATSFNKYGSLYFTEDVDEKYRADLPYNGETNPEFVDRWRIGPTTEKRFWKGSSVDIGAPYRGPWNTWQEYLSDTANVQVAYASDALSRDPASSVYQNAKQTAEWYKELVPSLFVKDEYPEELYSPRLDDPDVGPLNIIEQDDFQKFWLIDYENTAIRPFILHGVPWFVRNRGEKIYKKEDIPNYDQLPEREKMVVDHYIRLTQSEFTYEFLFHKLRPTLFQAFNPSIKRREEVVQCALATNIESGYYNDLDYAMYKMGEVWPFLSLKPPRNFPLNWTEQQIEHMSTNIQEWNAELARNSFLENKGFLAASIFDRYLGEGKLIPKGNGNYEFTKEFLDSLASGAP